MCADFFKILLERLKFADEVNASASFFESINADVLRHSMLITIMIGKKDELARKMVE